MSQVNPVLFLGEKKSVFFFCFKSVQGNERVKVAMEMFKLLIHKCVTVKASANA